MNDAIRMQISAFVDGELPANEAEMLVRRMSQDAELREQVADYLSTGRLIRGERSVPGMGRLRDRIAAEIDERPLQEDIGIVYRQPPRYVRPLAFTAIAATVALAAIFGLQQNVFVADPADSPASAGAIAGNTMEETYTVPDASDDMLQELQLIHGRDSLGLNNIGVDSRLISQVREGQLVEVGASSAEITAAQSSASDESDDAAAEPNNAPEAQTP
jgi:sigma-E factor negative regulatory protein RseA